MCWIRTLHQPSQQGTLLHCQSSHLSYRQDTLLQQWDNMGILGTRCRRHQAPDIHLWNQGMGIPQCNSSNTHQGETIMRRVQGWWVHSLVRW